ncbi:MAG: leucine-rich repeat domain-containing protein [Clostridia bacterium]|nr:leucine-rich repeat domain-containing protein [Clostridia bacterium]
MKKKIVLFLSTIMLLSLSLFGLTACSKESYTLEVIHYEGSGNWGQSTEYFEVEEGESLLFVENKELLGAEFAGWNIDLPEVMPSSNLTIKATYRAKTSPEDIFVFSSGVITGLTSTGKTYYAIKLPETIGGVTVTEIGDEAFDGADFQLFEFSRNVTVIGNEAFSGCNINKIELPESLVTLCSSAFEYTNIEELNIPVNVSRLGKSSNGFEGDIKNGAFYYMDTIKAFNVDSANETIASHNGHLFTDDGKTLIRYAPSSKATTYNVSAEKIHYGAFRDAKNLETINIGASVTEIGARAFYGTSNLKEIIVSPYCYDYYGEEGNVAVYYQPDSGDEIDLVIYASNVDNQSYVIKPGTDTVKMYAFENCTSLTSVTIPSSVTKLESGAFWNCTNLTSVIFEGTVEQWNAINKSSWIFNSQKLTTITCSNGTASVN